ncbi:hypothetical protein HED49_07740 [Ochrobactrum daejeonense]|nr:hypothetical protein [Brucella daejeonensis]
MGNVSGDFKKLIIAPIQTEQNVSKAAFLFLRTLQNRSFYRGYWTEVSQTPLPDHFCHFILPRSRMIYSFEAPEVMHNFVFFLRADRFAWSRNTPHYLR